MDGRSIHAARLDLPRTTDQETRLMTAAFDLSEASRFALSLEKRERERIGDTREARRAVASRVGVAPGTIENLRRGRLKSIEGWVRDRLRAAFIRELEAEIARLEHELALLRQCGGHPAADQVGEIEAHLEAARALMAGG